jgi:hypothetical protein
VIVFVVSLIAAAVIMIPLVLSAWRQHRTPAELRGEWWSRFESEFRAYADQAARRAANAKRAADARRPSRDVGP